MQMVMDMASISNDSACDLREGISLFDNDKAIKMPLSFQLQKRSVMRLIITVMDQSMKVFSGCFIWMQMVMVLEIILSQKRQFPKTYTTIAGDCNDVSNSSSKCD